MIGIVLAIIGVFILLPLILMIFGGTIVDIFRERRFKMLEGLIKEAADAPDMEEAESLLEEKENESL